VNRSLALAPVALVLALGLNAAPAAPAKAAPAPVHCQVPCGIYGDSMRIAMLMEDCATIEKGMAQIREMESSSTMNSNQMVRWIVTKDEHAAKIQEQVASYWLAQRIKAPADEAGRAKYLGQLELMHGITVAAMKCKQTVDPAHVEAIRKHAMAFSETYFSAEDLEHVRQHHGGEHK
jgi:nickel superoxide dismutase